MATINQILERLGRLKPCALEDGDKAQWLLELDGRIYGQVTQELEPDRQPPQRWPEDGDMPLLAPEERLYQLYATAMIEFSQGEYGSYNNTAALFEQAYQDYTATYRREHTPKPRAYQHII